MGTPTGVANWATRPGIYEEVIDETTIADDESWRWTCKEVNATTCDDLTQEKDV